VAVNALFKDRHAKTTQVNLPSKLNKFAAFCEDKCLITIHPATGEPTLPHIDATLLCFFVQWLPHNKITTFNSLRQYTSAVRGYVRDQGLPDPAFNDAGDHHPRLYGCMRAMKRRLQTNEVKRTPVTINMLTIINSAALSGVAMDLHLGLNIAAATSFMFFLLLRVSEITSPSLAFNPATHATRGDVEFHYDEDGELSHAVFSIKAQKSKEHRPNFTVVLGVTGTHLCPVHLLRRLFQEQPRDDTTPLFDLRSRVQRAKNQTIHVSRVALTKAVNECLALGDVDTATIKMHSFRQGGATAALAAGCPTWMLEILGRWKSDAWKAYAFLGIDQTKSMIKKMANAVHHPGVNAGRYIAF
jgi:hypothetical protein